MKKITLTLFMLLSAVFGFAQQMPQLPNDPETRIGKLENGLTYYIRHNEIPAQRAEFYLATNVGSIQETPEQDGLAHFLEHMCFNGTKNFPGKGILNYLEGIGASFGGNVNAGTGVEQTVYMLTNIPLVNATVVDSCLLIMHDYSHFVNCDPEEIDKERGVILEEKRTRNVASWRNYMASNAIIFEGTPYATNTLIGTEEQLKNFEYHHLTDFYHTWYRPDMQALIVVGDINVDEVEAKIKSTFADIAAAVNPKPKDVIEFPKNVEPVVGIVTDPETTSSSITVLWKSDPRPDMFNSTPMGLMQDLIQDIIGSVMAERFDELTSKADAPFLHGGLSVGRYNNIMDVVYGEVGFKDGEAVPALEAFLTEVEKMKRFGFTEDEVDRAKAEILSIVESRAKKAATRKNNEFVQPMIDNFFHNQALLTPDMAFQMTQMLFQQLNAEALNQVVAQIITKENQVVVYTGPKKEGLVDPTKEELAAVITKVENSEIKQAESEAIPTELLDATKLKGSKVVSTMPFIYGSELLTLKNGVQVILYPTDVEKDKINISIYKKGGRSLISDADLYAMDENIWSLYVRNSGIAGFSSTVLGKMLAGKNCSAQPVISNYTHGVDAVSTVKDVETAMQLLYLIYTQPRFDQEEYNKGIKQIEAILPNLVNQPNYKLQSEIYKTLFSHRKFMIDENVLAKANLKTLEKVYKNLFADAAGAVAVIAGDFERDQMVSLVEKYIGSLKKGGKVTNWINRDDELKSVSVVNDFKTVMQAPKTTVIQIWKAEGKYSEDVRAAYDALSYILDMVYTETLREDEGGTYGASSAPIVTKTPNEYRAMQVAFETNDAASARLRELAVKGIKDIAKDGPSADQFDKAKKNLEKNIPESMVRLGFWSNALKTYARYGIDSVEEYTAAVAALTPEAIKAVAEELVNGFFSELIMRPEE